MLAQDVLHRKCPARPVHSLEYEAQYDIAYEAQYDIAMLAQKMLHLCSMSISWAVERSPAVCQYMTCVPGPTVVIENDLCILWMKAVFSMRQEVSLLACAANNVMDAQARKD